MRGFLFYGVFIYMTRKDVVFKYLDGIFENAEISSSDTNYGTMYRVFFNNSKRAILISKLRKSDKKLIIFFNEQEFSFIRNIFGLFRVEATEFIKEYLSERIDPDMKDRPFIPGL